MAGSTKITPQTIAAMTPSQRATLYANAMKRDTDEARRIVRMIEQAGQPFSEGGSVKLDDPLTQAMRALIRSAEGRRTCIEATENGQPAIAGVDPLLAEKFGADYGAHNQTTNWAGRFVAEVMAEMGYAQIGREGDTPEGCIAKGGELYGKRYQ